MRIRTIVSTIALSTALGFGGPILGTSGTSFQAEIGWVPTPADAANPTWICNQSTECTGTVAVLNAPSMNMTYDSNGSAAIGTLHGNVDGSVTGVAGGSPPFLALMNSLPEFWDTVTFSGLSTGTVASMALSFTMHGNYSTNDGNLGGILFNVFVNSNNSVFGSTICQDSSPGTTTTVTCNGVNVEFGVPVLLQVQMQVNNNVNTFTPGSFVDVDFQNTAILTGISMTSGGQPVNFLGTSVSGTTYSADGVVPEPGTLAAGCAGLILLAALRRFKRTA